MLTQVRWRVNPLTIRERRQNEEVAASSVVSAVKGSKAAHGIVMRGIKAVGGWYRVEMYTNAGPRCRSELCLAGVTSRTNAAAERHVATSPGITGLKTTSSTRCDAQRSSDHSVVIHWRSALIAEEMTLRSATDARGTPMPPGRPGEAVSGDSGRWTCIHDQRH